VVDTENLSHKDLTTDSQKMEELRSENESLRGDVQALRLQVASFKDSSTNSSANSSGMSEKEASSKIASLEQENRRLASENTRLTKLSQSASQVRESLDVCVYPALCQRLLVFVDGMECSVLNGW